MELKMIHNALILPRFNQPVVFESFLVLLPFHADECRCGILRLYPICSSFHNHPHSSFIIPLPQIKLCSIGEYCKLVLGSNGGLASTQMVGGGLTPIPEPIYFLRMIFLILFGGRVHHLYFYFNLYIMVKEYWMMLIYFPY